MKAFVTGATGFIGSHLVARLRMRGWPVVCLIRRPVRCDDQGISCIPFDLYNATSLAEEIEPYMGKGDVFFHVAAVLPNAQTETAHYLTANAVSTARLLESAAKVGISFVYISSLPIIGKPEQLPITEDHPLCPPNPYLCSKLCGEMVCETMRRSAGLRIFSLRVTSPYGAGMNPDTVLPRFVRQVLASQDVHLFGTGQRTQNFVHVNDVVESCLLAANTDHPGVYNIAGPNDISMQNLAELTLRLIPESGSQVLLKNVPDPQDDYRWDVDLSKAKRFLGYSPDIPISEGLSSYISSIKSRNDHIRWWQPL